MPTILSSRRGAGLLGRFVRALRALAFPVRRAGARQRSAFDFMILASLSDADLARLGVTRAEVEAEMDRLARL